MAVDARGMRTRHAHYNQRRPSHGGNEAEFFIIVILGGEEIFRGKKKISLNDTEFFVFPLVDKFHVLKITFSMGS